LRPIYQGCRALTFALVGLSFLTDNAKQLVTTVQAQIAGSISAHAAIRISATSNVSCDQSRLLWFLVRKLACQLKPFSRVTSDPDDVMTKHYRWRGLTSYKIDRKAQGALD